ncbi:aminoglycoside phosphotransferase (APT) family kinase protein [Neorhizobium huautlense]|uniref:Aminoglycoside phosphotransferase (APT) family kinase protein n=1 Tax=Neorhizobium huautlense TaxID=67774 RepID=A0ABT9PQZ8_9HYPH|nr:aminoglycoside phosphotransferase family protein [Neorhizobium huautlense]MDP9836891.1 aminoglycoside phosphotransferase (APT) family kinase protein [Neorhizobium huautlense]
MHDDDISLPENRVRQLIADHTPQWAELPCERLASSGTDNALYRLGDVLLLRLPRRGHAVDLARKELDWLPYMQGLPLAVPNLRYRGTADLDQPLDFGIFDWLMGDIATPDKISDPFQAADDLAAFLRALHLKHTKDAPRSGPLNNRRGVALDDLSAVTLPAIDILADEIDSEAAHALWKRACTLPLPEQAVWLHGDLKADNLLARNGRLHAVLDWGLAAVGDPAADYATAWVFIDPTARDHFRKALDLSDEDWLRAEGWALYGAVIALSYYRGGRNEALCRQCRVTLDRLGLLLA